MSTAQTTFASIFQDHIGVDRDSLAPETDLRSVDGVSEEVIVNMFCEFRTLLMPLFEDEAVHRTLMRNGMDMSAEDLEAGKLRNLHITAGAPWTKQRMYALLHVWQNELPPDNGSS